MNFIFARLCDNDFGSILLEGVEFIWKNKECELTSEDFKHFLIEYMVFAQAIRRINPRLKVTQADTDSLRRYFTEKLDVTYETKQPEIDHDGGSAILNVHTGQAWRT